jgi:hypothetical protein
MNILRIIIISAITTLITLKIADLYDTIKSEYYYKKYKRERNEAIVNAIENKKEN